jgi:beta-N-acetylhexosaminidase
MVNLREKPYYLTDEQIQWVEDTIAHMSIQEKIGQLFCCMVKDRSEEWLRNTNDTFHPGAYRYQNASPEEIYEQNRILQESAKIPLLIACNGAAGGNGSVNGGTYAANEAALAAIDDEEAVRKVAEIAAIESYAVGCNWNFSPVVDLTTNWRNTIVQNRAFNDNPDDVIRYSRAFIEGSKVRDMATCIKHFPGDGSEENDQHLIMGVNQLSCGEWDNTFGKVYKTLIDDGVMTVMAGHIAQPAYSRKLRPGIRDEDIRPATLAPELITGLLKEKLGFNGLVITDASHMIGMFGATVPRREQVPGAIAAGCDMFLFFNDMEEDFDYMMRGYQEGVITEERLSDALHRILGVKAALKLPEKQRSHTLLPPKSELKKIGCEKHRIIAQDLADRYVTLVKDREHYLPLTPDTYPRLKMVYIGGQEKVIAGKTFKGDDEKVKASVKAAFEKEGFSVDAEELDSRGKTEEFRKKYSAVILVLNVEGFAQYNTMRVKWDRPAKQPWYMSEVPTVVLSLGLPNMLIDVPMARCFINTYMSTDAAISAAVQKICGHSDFKGRYNENVFCGRRETRI